MSGFVMMPGSPVHYGASGYGFSYTCGFNIGGLEFLSLLYSWKSDMIRMYDLYQEFLSCSTG